MDIRKVFVYTLIFALLLTGGVVTAFYQEQNSKFFSEITSSEKFLPTIIQTPTPAISHTPTKIPSPLPTIEPTQTPTPLPTATPLPTTTPIPTNTPAPTNTPIPKPTLEILAPASVKVRYGNTSKKEVALTFDDGGANMGHILNILNKKKIKGTFFLIAGELDSRPDRWRKAVADGHHVLNHSVSHKTDMAYRSDQFIINEILGWEKVAKRILGEEYLIEMKSEFPFFRPPGGSDSSRMRQILGNLGYPVMAFWSVEDYHFQKTNTKNISLPEHYLRETENGSIYLLHPYNYIYLESIIDKIQAKGYEFKLLAEIID